MNSLFASPRCFPYTTPCLLDGLVLGLYCAGHGGWSLVCRKDVNPHLQRCSTVNSDICTHHGCHFTAGRGHFGLLSAVPRRVHLPQGHASPHKGSDIDQGISADTTGAPAILLEDSRPQAILKFHRPSSLDYRAHHGLPVLQKCILNSRKNR